MPDIRITVDGRPAITTEQAAAQYAAMLSWTSTGTTATAQMRTRLSRSGLRPVAYLSPRMALYDAAAVLKRIVGQDETPPSRMIDPVTILMRIDANRQRMDPAEEAAMVAWLCDVGLDPKLVRAIAIEAPATTGLDDHYLLHVAEYVPGADGGPVIDPATDEAKLVYRTLRLYRADWPVVRVHAER